MYAASCPEEREREKRTSDKRRRPLICHVTSRVTQGHPVHGRIAVAQEEEVEELLFLLVLLVLPLLLSSSALLMDRLDSIIELLFTGLDSMKFNWFP